MARTLKTFRHPSVTPSETEGRLVLTPHRAAARAIGAPSKTLESLAREVVEAAGFVVASELEALMTLRAAVRKVVPDENPAAYMSRITSILKTVLRTGLDRNVLTASGNKKVSELGRVAEEYVDRLRAQSMIDRDETLMFAAGQEPERRVVMTYGYFRGRVEEARFIDAISAEGSLHFLPVAEWSMLRNNIEHVEWFKSQGWSTDDSGSQADTVGAEVADSLLGARNVDAATCSAFSYPNIDSEIRATLTEVKRLVLGGSSANDIAVLCRNPSDYGPAVSRIADEYGIRIDMRFKVPIAETGFGGFMHLVTDVLRNPGFENVLRLLMHPYGSGLAQEALHEAFRRHPAELEQWAAIGIDTAFLTPPEKLTRGNWAEFLKGLFDRFGTRKAVGVKAREILAYNEFMRCLNEFCLEPREELSCRQFIGEVHEILASCAVQFNPANGGIAFHNPDSVIGGSFKHLFVMGAAEGELPAAVSDNPVVDFIERKKLLKEGVRFESASDITRWEWMSIYFTLLTAGKSVTLSYPQSVDTEERMASELFEAVGLRPLRHSTPGDVVSSERELYRALVRHGADLPGIAQVRRAYEIELRRESAEAQDGYDGNIGLPYVNPQHDWSASQLKNIGQCGFKWFAQKLLGLKPIDEMEDDLSHATQGTLYHRALEFAVKRSPGTGDVRQDLLAVLEEAFAEAEADPKVKLPVLANWNLEREGHIALLRRVIESKNFISEGAKIVAVEQRFESEWEGFKLNGSIDRIDETPDGLIAIDYKKGGTAPAGVKDASNLAKVDIQLPLYIIAAIPSLEISGGNPGVLGIYLSLSERKVLKKVTLESEQELKDFAVRVKDMLNAGDFSVSPDKDKKACEYCDFDSVCRYGTRIKRKEAVKNVNEAV